MLRNRTDSVLYRIVFNRRLNTLRGWTKTAIKSVIGEARYQRFMYHVRTRLQKDAGYDAEYYAHIEQHNSVCYELFAKAVYNEFAPRTVLDVGCGGGGVLRAFMDRGCQAIGYDASSRALAIAREKGIDARFLDLTATSHLEVRGDLTLSLEVAEHLPERHAAQFCRLLASSSDVVVMTAAPPGQSGHLHVNEQPRDYWIQLMHSCGMESDEGAVARIRGIFGGQMIKDYDENLMVFRHTAAAPSRASSDAL